MTLPERGWGSYEDALKRLGERRSASGDERLLRFLKALDLVADGLRGLTETGDRYFRARFVAGDEATAQAILHQSVLNYPPAAAVAQLLAGVAGADRSRAETILRNQGFGFRLSARAVGSLLMLMKAAGLVEYSQATSR